MLAVRATFGLMFFAAVGAVAAGDEVSIPGLTDSRSTATFENGYVLGWDTMGNVVTVYARDGQRLFGIPSFSVRGESKPVIVSAAVDNDGTLALAYEGRGGGVGVALFDQTGKMARVIETRPYRTSQVCFAPDHSIWTLGTQGSPGETDDYPIFRHFSREGRELGAFVKHSEFLEWAGEESDLALNYIVGFWTLRAFNDRIGAVLPFPGYRTAWVELDLSGKLIGHWTYSGSRDEGIRPAAFTPKGALYGNRWIGTGYAGVVVFDKATSTWKPAPSLPNGHVIGTDGDQLVLRDGNRLRWIEEPGPAVVAAALAAR